MEPRREGQERFSHVNIGEQSTSPGKGTASTEALGWKQASLGDREKCMLAHSGQRVRGKAKLETTQRVMLGLFPASSAVCLRKALGPNLDFRVHSRRHPHRGSSPWPLTWRSLRLLGWSGHLPPGSLLLSKLRTSRLAHSSVYLPSPVKLNPLFDT